ncbi:hypothetical protein ACIBI0_38550 [Microbispora rosea]|uniref:hypothetical protein n=1 Tax=Microbispora rosea TaxID=58117 RepID=UPI0037B83B5C
MATPHTRPNGQVIDLDHYTPITELEKLDLIQEVLDHAEADDATRHEADPGYVIERVQRVLNMTTWEAVERH